MGTRHWEVEKKFPLSAPAEIRIRMATMGVEFGPVVDQVDHYFNHPARDFAVTDEAFRLRQEGLTNCITYKGPKIDKLTKTRTEIELPLPPGHNLVDDFAGLLGALGFCPAGTVHKQREPGRLCWNGHLVDVALDKVEGLGSYLELEIRADDESLAAAKLALDSVAQELGLGASERRSYLELMSFNNA